MHRGTSRSTWSFGCTVFFLIPTTNSVLCWQLLRQIVASRGSEQLSVVVESRDTFYSLSHFTFVMDGCSS